MSHPLVHNCHARTAPTGAVFIGRGSPWGNPFVIGKHGNRETVINKYREHLWRRVKTEPQLLPALAELHGKHLVCFCAPRPCHGDLLVKASAWAAAKMKT